MTLLTGILSGTLYSNPTPPQNDKGGYDSRRSFSVLGKNTSLSEADPRFLSHSRQPPLTSWGPINRDLSKMPAYSHPSKKSYVFIAIVAYLNCLYVGRDLPSSFTPSPSFLSFFTFSPFRSGNFILLTMDSHVDSNKAQAEHQEEKTTFNNVDTVDYKMAQGKVKEFNAASVALAAAVAAQKPSLLSKNMLKLYFIMSVGYLVSTMNGFDSSLMGAINAMTPYQESFGLSGAGKYHC
jgi:hypothetical protein